MNYVIKNKLWPAATAVDLAWAEIGAIKEQSLENATN